MNFTSNGSDIPPGFSLHYRDLVSHGLWYYFVSLGINAVTVIASATFLLMYISVGQLRRRKEGCILASNMFANVLFGLAFVLASGRQLWIYYVAGPCKLLLAALG